MNTEIWIAIIGILSTIVGSFCSWFFTKKKYNADVDAQTISNLSDAVKVYKQICDDTKEEMKQYREEVIKLRGDFIDVMKAVCLNLTCPNRVTGTFEQVKETINTENNK